MFKPLLDAGVVPTNGFRTPADIERLRRAGYKPASKSLHLDGDAIDLTPGKSGMTLNELKQRTATVVGNWPGARIVNEGNHVHAQLPGWGMAPGTPGTPNSGLPPMPNGFELQQRGSLRASNMAQPGTPAVGVNTPGKQGPLIPTGRVHDGDTFRLNSGANARLTGVDAFELKQTGRRDGKVTPLGVQARALLTPFATPTSSVTPTGAMTYGRPVVSLSNGQDAGRSLLLNGLGIATPKYLADDPARLVDYMEAERGARLNRRGAFDGKFQTPSSFRHDGPWAEAEFAKAGQNGIAVFNDEPLPFQGLRPEIADGYRSIWQDMASKPDDLLAFAKANGFSIDPAATRKAYAHRAKTGLPSSKVTYIKPPRVLTDPGDGKTGTTLRGVADPINMLDEMGALVDTVGLTQGRENVFTSDRRFGDILANNLDQNRSILAHDEATAPYWRMGGQLASGIALPIGGGARTAVQLARIGAVEGGLAGFGAGEGGVTARMPGAGLGAGLGAAGGFTLGKVGEVASAWWRGRGGRREGVAALPKGFDLTEGPHGPIHRDLAGDYPAALARLRADQTGEVPGAIRHPELGDVDLVWGDKNYGLSKIIDRHPEVVDDLPGIVERRPVRQRPEETGNNRFVLENDTHRAVVAPDFNGVEQRWLVTAFERKGAPGDLTSRRDPLSPDGVSTGGGAGPDIDLPGVPGNAAMVADDISPTLIGPSARAVDRIDVNDLPPPPPGFELDPALGRVRSMDARSTPQQMAELASRVSPGDVTPLPYNRVNSLEEAVVANPGSVRDVEAPDEMSVLETRRFPNGSGRATYQLGPVDLVGFLRRGGGIQDQGGELSHLGIDNARRAADFAGNEQFLGRLVNPEGSTFDDAALRAWEAGYFPEHSERPSIDDFIDAVSETYSGFNRRFHPDDLEEVARFEGTRDQRNLVEQAQADGVRLGEEVGQPISLADLEANQAPATAYEDLPTLGGKAGNIALDRLETRGDIRRALTNTEAMFGGFDAARRGKISHEETAALADELGMRADDLLKRRQGQALNAEQALGARRILARSGDELVALAAKTKGGSDADLGTFQKAMLRHAAIQEQVTGATAEAGRALSQFKMAARSKDHHEAIMRAIVDSAGGRKSVEDIADQILELQKVPGALNKFALDAVKPTWKDKAVELYYNSLLSSPATHAVNILSNAMTSVLSIPEQATASALGMVRIGSVDRVMASELGPRVVGLMQGAMEGLKAARLTFKTGRVPDHVTKVEAAMQEAIPGKLGHVLRTPTRALSAEDEFFKAVARRSELASLAVRKARGEGLKGDALTARIDELTRSPDAAMMERAMEFARYQTFQNPVGELAGAVLGATRSHPWLKLIVPFVRTPTNILKFAAERSPLAPMLKQWRGDMLAGGARRDLAITRSTLGTGLGLTIAQMASDGLITGGGPADPNAKRIKMADGWQPYSLKIGDKYYSYQRLDPLATTIGVAADYVDKSTEMTDRQRDESAMMLTASIIQNLSDKTWLSGLSDAIAAINDPMRDGPAFIRKTAASMVTPAASAQLARTIDSTQRETKTVAEAVQARIPYLSDSLRPKLDAWGAPIVKEGGIGPNIMSPVYLSTGKNKAINAEALRLGLKATDPSRTVAGERLTNEQFHRYRATAGQLAAKGLADLMAMRSWRSMDDEKQRKAFDDMKADSRKAARETLGLVAAMKNAPRKKSALAASSRSPVAKRGVTPSALRALPNGFELER